MLVEAAAVPCSEEGLREVLAWQDVVLLHNVLTMPFRLDLTAELWRLADMLRRVRFVHWVHDVAALDPFYEGACGAAENGSLLSRAHPRVEYVAVSEVRRRQFCRLTGLGLERCRVIPNGIDLLARLGATPLVREVAERWRLLQREVVLFHPARLVARKNLGWSVRVLAALVEQGKDAVLVLTAAPDPHAGSTDSGAEDLAALARELGAVERVLFFREEVGAAPSDRDVDCLYMLADALLFPSLHEGFGLPIIEAALHRLLIFCSDIPTLTELLPAGSVTHFSPGGSSQEAAKEIMRQVERSGPIQSRKAAVRRYGWPAVYRKYLAPLLAASETSPPL